MKCIKKALYSLPLILLSANSYATEPRSYVLLPNDINLAEINYMYGSTEKLLPNSAMVKNESNSVGARYLRTFGIMDTYAAAYILLPYTKNKADISMGPMQITERMDSMSDARLFFGIGIYNAPSLSREEYAKHDKNGTRAACSTALTIPTGSYDQTNLVNIGSKQYSLKSECITTYTQNRLVAEFATGFTKYTDNKDFAPGLVKSQDNLYHTEAHLSYDFTPKLWASLDAYYQLGGEQSINNISSLDRMKNTSVGVMASYNLSKGLYARANYIKTVDSPKFAAKNDYLILYLTQLF